MWCRPVGLTLGEPSGRKACAAQAGYGVCARCYLTYVWLVVYECMPMPQFFSAPVMARKRGKRRNRGRRQHRRSPAAVARRRMRGGERLDRALCGLVACRLVRRVLLVSGVKIFFQVDIPKALAPAVLRDAAWDIVRCLHGEPGYAIAPNNSSNLYCKKPSCKSAPPLPKPLFYLSFLNRGSHLLLCTDLLKNVCVPHTIRQRRIVELIWCFVLCDLVRTEARSPRLREHKRTHRNSHGP